MNLKPVFPLRWVAALGLSAVFVGLVGLAPASADRDDYHAYQRDHISHDISDVRRDEDRLHDLEYRRDEARRCRRYEEARDLDIRIRDLRIHIADDRRDIHHDIDRARRDRDRDYRDSDRSRYRNSDYRQDDSRYNRDRYNHDGYRARY